MKKIIKYFSVILFCSFFMFLLTNNRAEANYDSSKNTVNVSVNENQVKITVRYQRGISRLQAVYKWCQRANENSTECVSDVGSPIEYISIGGDGGATYIAQGEPDYVDNNITTVTFTVPKANDPFLSTPMYSSEEHYSIVVQHYFCSVRNSGSNSCMTHDEQNTQTVLHVKSNDLLNHLTVGGTGDSLDGIENDEIRTMMEKIYAIVHGTVMPIIWGVLGLFLVVKGALLGVQIVKSADEPQVRQEKVGSLKWLVIGVAIAYASSFLVDIVIGFFSNAFN